VGVDSSLSSHKITVADELDAQCRQRVSYSLAVSAWYSNGKLDLHDPKSFVVRHCFIEPAGSGKALKFAIRDLRRSETDETEGAS
jgi:hypothetical protein